MQFHTRKDMDTHESAPVSAAPTDRSGGARCAPIDLQWPKVWQNPTPIPMAGRPGAWTIIVPDKGYGGVYTYPIYTPSRWLFTQLTRRVLRKRVGAPRACNATRTHASLPRRAKSDPNQLFCVPRGKWKNGAVPPVIRRDVNVREELA